MKTSRPRFDTDVEGIWGYWPETPRIWSYSSLNEMEVCPRRWMLSRATYPDLWNRQGYPPLPATAAMFGNVVHGVVERLAGVLANAGIEVVSAGTVVSVLGDLGGWRGIVTDEIEHQLTQFGDNPRVSTDRIDRAREELLRRVSQAADQVKVFLGRGVLAASSRPVGNDAEKPHDGTPRRLPAVPGTHFEREIRAEALRITGRVDLLIIDDADVTIVDFKTGEDDATHDDQVRLYALLWRLDDVSNPDHRPATKLEIAYPSHTRSVSPLDATASEGLRASTFDRITAADDYTRSTIPIATPSPRGCQFCSVKHLCDVYWTSIPPSVSAASPDDWLDFEGRVLAPQGRRSWYFESSDTSAKVLVRTVRTDIAFPQGSVVRLLGVRRTIDPDDEDRLVISMVSTSEWYSVSA